MTDTQICIVIVALYVINAVWMTAFLRKAIRIYRGRICPHCNGYDRYCMLCDGRGYVSIVQAAEWRRQQ